MAANQKYKTENLVALLDKYTNDTDIPILKEVCYQNYLNYDTIMKYQRTDELLMQSIKRLLDKKESQLERKGLNKEIDRTVAIFSLKQLGWKDKQEISFGEEQADEIDIKIIRTNKEDIERVEKIEKGLYKNDS
ncbi:MAG: DNA-packaging protein [Clostridia bacterium]|jgi:hypothetical protein|nr:DNA-packaging protein [Clostridia bacterium]